MNAAVEFLSSNVKHVEATVVIYILICIIYGTHCFLLSIEIVCWTETDRYSWWDL